MFGTHNLSLFVASCLLLNITPGQDTLFILGRSIAHGKKAGVISVAGIMSGILMHTLFAALGLSVILNTSAFAFNAIKYIGAAYLIWIGINMFRSERTEDSFQTIEKRALAPWGIYRQGLLTNLLNPKVSLFFLSFLPQFVDPSTEYTFIPFILLGLILFTTGTIWCLLLAYCASWLTLRFRNRGSLGGMLKKITGTLFIGLGIKLALAQRR